MPVTPAEVIGDTNDPDDPDVLNVPDWLTFGHEARTYAHRGLPVGPLCWPDADGHCGCGRHHAGKSVGKAPLTPNGHLDFATDQATIQHWLHEHPDWRDANIGVDLERAGLIVVDADSPAAVAEIEQWGHPRCPIVSTGREGGRHYYFRRPAGCPTERDIHSGESHEIDLLSAGYAILPGSRHASGRTYTWMVPLDEFTGNGTTGLASIPEAPEWVVMCLNAAHERHHARKHVTAATPIAPTESAEPPVVLTGTDRAYWDQTVWLPRVDGGMDRSRTLHAVGVALTKAGLKDITALAAALKGWDLRLSEPKFAYRKNADDRYLQEAQSALNAVATQFLDDPEADEPTPAPAVQATPATRGTMTSTREPQTPLVPAARTAPTTDDSPAAEPPGPPPDLNAFPHTDTGNGEALIALYRDQLAYDEQQGRWLVWGGHTWRRSKDSAVYQLAVTTARARQEAALAIEDLAKKREAMQWAVGSENEFRLKSTVTMTRLLIADDHTPWDANPWLLGCANGVVDLRTGALWPGQPDDHITRSTGITFDPAAGCPRWLRFLDEVFAGDQDLVAFVRRAAGYSLTGCTTEQCLFLCHGLGANGKSTLLAGLRHIQGAYADNTPFDTLIEPRFGDNTAHGLASLVGARLVTSSEVSEHSRLNEARVKAITGGDPVTTRFLYKEFFTFAPQFKLWLAVNHKPVIRGDDDGIWRRILPIPFTQSFRGREDLTLEATLRAEAPGILAWAVKGCREWQASGLAVPDVVTRENAQYRKDSDVFARFIEECCVVGPNRRVPARILYEGYVQWTKRNGEYQVTHTLFGRRLTERGFKQGVDTSGRTRMRLGLDLEKRALPPADADTY